MVAVATVWILIHFMTQLLEGHSARQEKPSKQPFLYCFKCMYCVLQGIKIVPHPLPALPARVGPSPKGLEKPQAMLLSEYIELNIGNKLLELPLTYKT